MNKPKYQMTNRAKKKMNKEVRTSFIQPDPEMMSDHIKTKNLLSKYPKKIQKKEQALLTSLDKNIAIQRKKKKAPHSKRTTPGQVEGQSAPQIIHIEGKRWIKAIESQVQAKKQVMRRQALKKQTLKKPVLTKKGR